VALTYRFYRYAPSFGSDEPVRQVNDDFLCYRHEIIPFTFHHDAIGCSFAPPWMPYSPKCVEVDFSHHAA
jgi:hypothetical protein